jgi:NhaP-type Na+/H+ or K+/H+ antiporter
VEHFEIFLAALFVSVAGLNAIARWLSVPYPIPLVLGGLALGLVPGIPEIELEPDLVLLIFLPPLLYSAAFFSDLRALRDDLRAISIASIGLVLLTIGTVALAAHEVIGMSWPLAFALGAIVSPTDPVAATAIMRQLGAPRRLVNFIEGESLVNDATALVAYRVAVAAAVGGTFSALDAGLEFMGRQSAGSRSASRSGSWSGRSGGGSRTRPRRSRSPCSPRTRRSSRRTSSASRGCWRPSARASTSAGGPRT